MKDNNNPRKVFQLTGMLLFAFGLSCIQQAKAQMQPAKIAEYAVEKYDTLSAPFDKVWHVLSDIESLSAYSGGYITKITAGDKPRQFMLTLKDKTQRLVSFDIIAGEGDLRMSTLNVQSPLPEGITTCLIVFKASRMNDPGKTAVRFAAVIEGDPAAKARLKQKTAKAFESLAGALKHIR